MAKPRIRRALWARTVLSLTLASAGAAAALMGQETGWRPLVSDGQERSYEASGYAPAVRIGDLVIGSGVIGLERGGDNGPTAQFRRALEALVDVLSAHGLTLADVAEITTYHVDLGAHGREFIAVKNEFWPDAPYPAWTAIGVDRLFLEPALIEIGFTAVVPPALSAPPGLEALAVDSGEASIRGLVAGPPDADGGVLVVHDWFGVSPAMEEAVARLAGRGYRVLLLDLYHGERATNAAEAQALMASLEPARVEDEVRTAVDYLAGGGRPVVSLGFSLGTGPAMTAAFVDTSVTGAVNVYGTGGGNVIRQRASGLPVPLLFVTGSEDPAPMGVLKALLGTELGSEKVEAYVYPGARHGYAQPLYDRGANLDRSATEASWAVIESFIERRLRPQPMSADRPGKGEEQ